MPSSFTHAIAGAAVASPLARDPVPLRFWIAAACCAALPDVDILWGRYVTWGTWLAHRGFTHSLAFAVVVGVTAAFICFRDPQFAPVRWRYAVALALAAASHCLLDGMARYGTHVMFLWPFSTHRYLLPWTVFGVPGTRWPHSSLGRLARVAENEITWGWTPSTILLGVTAWVRRAHRAPSGVDPSPS